MFIYMLCYIKSMKEIRRKIESIESGAYYTAAEVLLIGLNHIKTHRMSHPIGLTEEQWFDEIVPELIWYLGFANEDNRTHQQHLDDKERTEKAKALLGEHFYDIWC